MEDIFLFAIFMTIFAAVFALLGYLGYRKTKTAEDYFVAGRKMSGIIVAFSYGATFISAVALIGFSRIASIYGLSLLWLAFLNIFVGIIIAFVFYGFRTRKMGLSLKAMTLPELLGNRFNSPKLQSVSGLIIAVFMVIYTSAVFLAIASLFQVTFGIPYEACVIIFTIVVGLYLIVGGLYAVMWTYAIQGMLMVIGMLGGFIFTMLWYIFVYAKSSSQILGASLVDNYVINMLDPLFIGVPLSFLLTFIFSIWIKQDAEEKKLMQKSFENI